MDLLYPVAYTIIKDFRWPDGTTGASFPTNINYKSRGRSKNGKLIIKAH